MNYAVMPLQDWQNILNSTRVKTGKTDFLKSGDVATEIDNNIIGADEAFAEAEYVLTNGYSNYNNLFKGKSLEQIPMYLFRHIEQGNSFADTFSYNANLVTVPVLNTLNGKNFSYTFSNCTGLITIEGICVEKATTTTDMFKACKVLAHITFIGQIKRSGFDFSSCVKLTHDSLIGMLNALYDYASEGSTSTYTLTVGSTNINKLTSEEQAIPLAKGWTLK